MLLDMVAAVAVSFVEMILITCPFSFEENSIMVIWSKILISQAPSKFQPIGHDDVKALQVVLLKYFVLLSSHQVENPISI